MAAGQELYRGGVVDNRRPLAREPRHRNRAARARTRAARRGARTSRKSSSTARRRRPPWRRALRTRRSLARERSEVAAFLAATMRPNLTYNATDDGAPPRAGRALGRDRADEDSRAARSSSARATRSRRARREWIDAARASVSDPSSWVKVAGIAARSRSGGRGRLLARRAAAAPAPAGAGRRESSTPRCSRRGSSSRSLTRGAFGARAERSRRASRARPGPRTPTTRSRSRPARSWRASSPAWARRCSSRPSTRSARGLLMGQSFSFVLFALVGSLAGIFGLGKLRSRSVLLAMGGHRRRGEPRLDLRDRASRRRDARLGLRRRRPRRARRRMVRRDARRRDPARLRAPLPRHDRHPPARALEPEPAAPAHARARGAGHVPALAHARARSPRPPPRRSAPTRCSPAWPATTTTSARFGCPTTSSRTSRRASNRHDRLEPSMSALDHRVPREGRGRAGPRRRGSPSRSSRRSASTTARS